MFDSREKLIELLHSVDVVHAPTLGFCEFLADFLIANGVTVQEDGCEVCRRHVPPGANYCWKCGRPLR